ncbi:B12-binding domain-containing radical SAM protein [Candidatus Margulisiibacteriota bacterium]
MDILLIEPPPTNEFGNMRQFGSIGTYKADIAYPPIDLMKIAGCLREHNIDTCLYDANTLNSSLDDVAELIKKEKPRLVIFTASTTTINKDVEIARRAKKISKDIITATFGAHIKGAPVQTLEENDCLDVAIYGDPEFVTKELVRNEYDLSKVKGIVFRQGGEIINQGPHVQIDNLDEYGIAAHDKIDPNLYRDPFSKRTPLTVTYGQLACINKCAYCMSTLYGDLRMRSVDHFYRELEFIVKLGFKEVFFIDCGFTNNSQWINQLVDKMIAKSLDLTWWCLSRADCLDEQLMRKMKAAGCHSIGVGVESVNAQIIKNTGKNVDPQQVLKIVKLAKKIGLRILLYFQFGLPGETRASMQESLDFALKSGADLVTFGIATPVPGTKFYEYIKHNGYLIEKDWSKFDPALPPVYSYPNLSSQEIFEFSQKAYKAFYLRPSFVIKRFLGQRSWRDVKNNYSNFMNFVNRMFSSREKLKT